MNGTKWEDSGSWSRAFVGDERASVGWMLIARDDRASVIAYNQDGNDHMMVDRRASSRDEAKTAAEQALREMHDALSAHFAPVLRWECDLHSVATLGQWFLQADSEEWSVMVCPPNGERAVVASGDQCTTRENNRRAAEAALRELGVVFRVKGE